MSCFIVPLTQAVITSVYRKLDSKSINQSSAIKHYVPTLEKMLWGGSVMLIVDHILSGELSWRFPFLTALNDANGAEVVLHELIGVGLPMSFAITAVWAVYALLKMKKPAKANI